MNVVLPTVSTCCCFISLRTGAKLFGFISLLASILIIFISCFEILNAARYARQYLSEIAFECGVIILVQTVQSISSVCLLMGIYQERRLLVRPWLISTPVVMVLEAVLLMPIVHWLFIVNFHYEWITTTIFTSLDDLYGCLVVYSYYGTLSDNVENHPS